MVTMGVAQRRLAMSLSFSPTIRQQRAPGSALVILGMLTAALVIVALSAAFGMGSPDVAALTLAP
jgi:hypothetical protein